MRNERTDKVNKKPRITKDHGSKDWRKPSPLCLK